MPEFVRESLARLAVPGFCVFRWERYWHTEGQPFRDPSAYPAVSVATSGTHDTEPLAVWWPHASDDERQKIASLPTIRTIAADPGFAAAPYDAKVRDVLLESLFASRSQLLLFPVQDVFGWRDRINEPATVTEKNWTFRLPWPVDRLSEHSEARERTVRLCEWARRYHRHG